MPKSALVTGAGGFLGRRVVTMLLSRGYTKITSVDVRFPGEAAQDGETRLAVDIRSADEVLKAVRTASPDVVVHIASFGMSGPSQLKEDIVHAVNVTGTKNLVDACVAAGVPAFVYVSTYNVVFNGCTIVNGTEDAWPVLPPEAHVDPCAALGHGCC